MLSNTGSLGAIQKFAWIGKRLNDYRAWLAAGQAKQTVTARQSLCAYRSEKRKSELHPVPLKPFL